jgi:hypothetical protein
MTTHARHGFPKGHTAPTALLRENGLTLAMVALFVASLVGQVLTGHAADNEELAQHGGGLLTVRSYVTSGHFIESVFENWESEFLQMAIFVVLTKYLRQKGSSESKKLDDHEEVDEDPREHRAAPGAPWAVRKGGIVLALYERSLSLALIALFLMSFALHAIGGARAQTAEERRHGGSEVSTVEYVATSKFWFESFQNWQSEFLSVGALIVLSIFLRERGSSQSKPVHKPHSETED